MTDARLTLLEAISRRMLVESQYNGATIRLAPHLMFERHGDLFVAALNLGKIRVSEFQYEIHIFIERSINPKMIRILIFVYRFVFKTFS